MFFFKAHENKHQITIKYITILATQVAQSHDFPTKYQPLSPQGTFNLRDFWTQTWLFWWWKTLWDNKHLKKIPTKNGWMWIFFYKQKMVGILENERLFFLWNVVFWFAFQTPSFKFMDTLCLAKNMCFKKYIKPIRPIRENMHNSLFQKYLWKNSIIPNWWILLNSDEYRTKKKAFPG